MEYPSDWAHKKGIRILGVEHGIASNVETLIHDPVYFVPGEIYSQVTNWEKIEGIEYGLEMDSYCFIHDTPELAFDIRAQGKELHVQGDISTIEKKTKDHRWALLGNVGLWYRHALKAQESKGIFSLHAAAIYNQDEDELFIIVGKAGSGKTVFLLEAISRGCQIFSTEMTYFKFSPEGVHFLRGALYDNIRIGSFVYDFPAVAEALKLDLPRVENPWDHKISVDLHALSSTRVELVNPTLSFVFPRIEKGIEQVKVKDITDPKEIARRLFDSASEKIGSTFLIYDSFPVGSLDTSDLAAKRWQAVERLVTGEKWAIKQAKSSLAGPKNCMEEIFK
ncbi:MAG: hypothetical protein ACERKX_13025 [Anaerolineales bacterium]